MFRLLLLLIFVSTGFAQAQPVRSNDKILRVFGFCTGQDRQLEFISENFPDLASEAAKAKADFSKTFGKSCDYVDGLIPKPTKLEIISRTDAAIRKNRPDNIGAVKLFLEYVRKRARGENYSPIKEYLLAFHPGFSAEPQAELQQGYKKVFFTRGHPKSFGLNLELTLPFSWYKKESKRKNIVQVFSSSGFDDGLLTIALSISRLPLRNGKELTNAQVNHFFRDDAISDFAKEGEELLESGQFSFGRQPGGYIITGYASKRFGIDRYSQTLTYITYKDGKMIFIACVVNGTEKMKVASKAGKFRPLFVSVAKSLSFDQRRP